jgi:hypothetical protein
MAVGSTQGLKKFMTACPYLIQLSSESRRNLLLPLDQMCLLELRLLDLSGVWVTPKGLSHVIATTTSPNILLELAGVTLRDEPWDSFWITVERAGHQVALRKPTNASCISSSVLIHK